MSQVTDRIGHVLEKATQDVFTYALKLRTGEVVRFISAQWNGGDWIYLDLDVDTLRANGVEHHGLPIDGSRGVDVRLSEIVWAADAPDGS